MAKTIMVVDDSISIRQVVGLALKQAGYDVIEGCDGRDALAKLTGQKVNLIISDVYSPGGSSDQAKGDKAPKLRKWQIEMLLNPQAEVREDSKTAAVELSK